jgi:HK97 family phage prohead protease
MQRELRSGPAAETRSTETGVNVSGYAAVYGQRTLIGSESWGFYEVIEEGAFDDAIGRDDVVFLINHEGLPLARTRSGTLTLSSDNHGLKMETTLDGSDPDVQSIVPKMQRGDLDKMSFAFLPEVQEWDETQSPPVRTIKKASLFDVSIVTSPAYDGTEIGLRSLDEHRKVKRATNFNAANRRLKMKMHLDLKVRENG